MIAERPPFHWTEYAIEAAALGAFLVSAAVWAVALYHPDSPLAAAISSEWLRRAAMGLAMGLTAIASIYSKWGPRSGAHMNPAVTLTFFRLGKVERPDFLGYVLAQFAGGIAGIALMAALLGGFVSHASIRYVVTAPGPAGEAVAKHSLDFWLTSEDLPDPDNRVTLDRDGNIVLSYKPNNLHGHERLMKKLESLLKNVGMGWHLVPRNLFVGTRIPLAGVAHQNGTVRFGKDPKTSALDVNCKAHEVDNLYVVDSSFFVSSSAVNPALTIMANALRVGDHLLERLGVPAF